MLVSVGALRRWMALHGHARVDRETVERFRDARLRAVVAAACEHVPYYRRLFRAHGLAPADIRTAADLQRVPITTRAQLQDVALEDRLARGRTLDGLNQYRTSGASGRPLAIGRHWIEDMLLSAIRVRAMKAFGLRGADRVALVRALTGNRSNSRLPLQRLLATVRPSRWTTIDAARPATEVLADLVTMRPAVITGYPGTLAAVADADEDGRLRALGARFATTGGEVLTPVYRERITTGFGIPVHDTYGSCEFDLLAAACPATPAYHVADDGVVLEVVRDGAPVAEGEEGEIVATALHSHAMPFIRFALGDVVRKGAAACACGAPFSTIHAIQGRVIENFPLPDGRVVHPYGIFIPIQLRAPWIRQFEVVQTATDAIVMRIVARSPPSRAALDEVHASARAALGPAVRFAVEIVPVIPFEASGKFRTYRSAVPARDPTPGGASPT